MLHLLLLYVVYNLITLVICIISNIPCILTEPAADYIKSSAETVMKIHKGEGPGDILVFLTGAEEVETCVSHIKEHTATLSKDQG